MFQLAGAATVAAVMITATFSIANFAYDASMINNLTILPAFLEYFNLDSKYIGLNVAILNVGSIAGGPFGGMVLDGLGRKRGLMVASLLQLVGAAIAGSATTEAQFLVGRFVLGFSFVLCGTCAPMWVLEVAPPKYKGILTNTMISVLPVAGTVAAGIILGIYASTSNWAWRGSLLGELVGPILSLIVLPFACESPRWLVSQDRKDEAFDLLVRLHGHGDREDSIVLLEYQEICETLEFEKRVESSWKTLASPAPNRRRFTISVLINIFFQVAGSNTMPYFFALILVQAGITDMKTNLSVNLGLCVWGGISTGLGVVLIDKLGTKRALIIATIFMSICLILLAVVIQQSDATGKVGFGYGAIAVVFIFQFFGFSSWMLLNYSYPPEILKFTQRSKGVSVSQGIGYGFAVLMTYTLPIALENIGWKYYALNAGWNVLIIAVIWWLFVETKGKTLEEIDQLFEGQVHFGSLVDGEKGISVIEGVKGDGSGDLSPPEADDGVEEIITKEFKK